MSEFRTRNWIARSVVLLVALLFAVPFASAQVTTGNLQGVVKDPNGQVVAGAAVKVTNVSTGISRETTTNDEGFYRVTNLLPGNTYAVEVTASGFEVAKAENVPVRLATENSADIQLSLQGVTGTVQVTAEQTLIQTTQSQLSQSYTPQQLTQLPFNGGAIDNLALLTPGVVTPGDADFTNGVGISSNGNRGRSNNFQIDGQDNNDNSVAGPALSLTNTDAIGEFQVITNNFSAEFGRNSGAQVNVITKSGTNEYHGTAFEYFQNSALNTTDNLDKQSQKNYQFLVNSGFTAVSGLARRAKDPFTYNRFGGSIGGPLKQNKAFFFFTYQGDRQRGEAATNNLTSDSLILTDASAHLAAALFPNPSTANLISTNVGGGPTTAQGVGTLIVAPPLLDTNGDGVGDTLAYGPANPVGNPNNAAFGFFSDATYVNNGGVITPLLAGEGIRIFRTDYSEDQIITREDINFTDKDVLSARYIYDNTKFPLATGTALIGALFDVPSKNNNLGVTYTRTLSSRFVNEARFTFSRLDVRFGDPTGTKPGPGISLAATGTINLDAARSFGTANNLPQSRLVDVYQEQDTFSATLGNHAVKVGMDLRQQKVKNFFLPNFLGVYQFAGSTACFSSASATSGSVPAGTFFFAPTGTPNFCTGGAPLVGPRTGFRATSLENLILNRPRQVTFARGNPAIKTDQNDFFFFFQDDWRVRPSLTLNLGLRYEVSTQPLNPIIEAVNAREADPTTALFDPAFPLATRTAARIPVDKNNIAPRVGFAWQPNLKFLGERFTDGRTVIRGGFGIAYDPSFFNIVLNTVTAAPFAVAGIVRQNPNAATLPGGVRFPFLPTTIAQQNTTPGTNGGDPRLFSQTRVSPDFHNPYTMQYNFGIQQELWKNTVLEARYVGSRIVGQFQTVSGNPNVQFLNRAAQCLGLPFGSFSNGIVVGLPAASQAAACTNVSGFSNRAGTNGDGRVDPVFGQTRTRLNGASATYNGLQLRFDTRFSNQLTLNANYTLSKTLDNASEIFSTGGGGQGVADPQRFFDANDGERGLSAFHQKHNFTANFIWDMPWYKEQRGTIGKFLGGYQLAGLVRMGSGRPYTPLEAFGTYDPAFENAFFGVGALRPFNGNPSAPEGTIAFGFFAACAVLFTNDPACLSAASGPGNFIVFNTLNPGTGGTLVANGAAAAQQARLIYNDFGIANQFGGVTLNDLEAFQFFRTPFGDVGRNTFSGLPFYGVNLAVFKTTNITERTKLEFRLEAQNLLNRRNFGVPDAFTEDASNGFVVSSFQNPGFNNGSQRELRFGLRLIF